MEFTFKIDGVISNDANDGADEQEAYTAAIMAFGNALEEHGFFWGGEVSPLTKLVNV